MHLKCKLREGDTDMLQSRSAPKFLPPKIYISFFISLFFFTAFILKKDHDIQWDLELLALLVKTGLKKCKDSNELNPLYGNKQINPPQNTWVYSII